ncbi:glycosyltransferase [Schlesneria sp.]|uniref:glycosyltransferase n=1 Tax=Schlesneria sp. TaxID=2762018 RepID=UPI002EF8A2AB
MNSFPVQLVAWLIATAWCAVLAVVIKANRNRHKILRPLPPGTTQANPQRLSVIVPARNEQDCVEVCIRSLLRQDYPDLEVIAVNDRSTDQTATILDRLSREFPDQVRVLHIESLPEGWFGKPHALDRAMALATGKLLLFTDSDCEFLAPSALRTAVSEFESRGLNFFTIGACYTMPSLREQLVVPACSEVVLQWLRPERVEDPDWPDTFANGAFILTDRAAFERLGGWSTVRTKVSEDFELARAYKRAGYRTGLAQALKFYNTRSYGSMRESWDGWSRILAGALTIRQLMTTVLRMSIMTYLPLCAVILGAVHVVRTGDLSYFARGAMPAFLWAYLCRTGLDFTVYRLIGAPVSVAILAPVGRAFAIAASLRAALARAGIVRTYWRGAAFTANRLVTPQSPSVAAAAPNREIRAESAVAPHAAVS